jgi:hypothetical protein
VNVPIRQVIWAEVIGDSLELCFLARKRDKGPLQINKIKGQEKAGTSIAKEWTEALMCTAYEGPVLNLLVPDYRD